MKRIVLVLAVVMLCLGCGRYGRVITSDKTDQAILARPEAVTADKPVSTNTQASDKQGSTQAAVPQGEKKK